MLSLPSFSSDYSVLRSSSVAWAMTLLAVPTATLLFTWRQYVLAASKTKDEKVMWEPPPVPYSIPLIGNALSFAFDTARFLKSLRCVFCLHPLPFLIAGLDPTANCL